MLYSREFLAGFKAVFHMDTIGVRKRARTLEYYPSHPTPPYDCVTDIDDLFGGLGISEQNAVLHGIIRRCNVSQLRMAYEIIYKALRINFVSRLPVELVSHIFGMLDIWSLCQARLACKRWNQIIREDYKIWQCMFNRMKFSLPDLSLKEAGISSSSSERTLSLQKDFQFQYQRMLCWNSGRRSWSVNFEGHSSCVVTCLAYVNSLVYSGSDDGSIQVWCPMTGQRVTSLLGHTGGVWAMDVGLDGLVVSGATDRTCRVWNSLTGICDHVLEGHTSTVRCLVISKDQRRVISGSRDFSLRIWDLKSASCLHVLLGHEMSVRCLCISPDNRFIISGSYDTTVRVWDLESGAPLHVMEGHSSKVYSLICNSNDIVISGSMDNTVRVWDLNGGSVLHVLKGHKSLVPLLAVHGDFLVSASADSEIRTWNLRTGENTQRLTNHSNAITCLGLDSFRIISGSDGSLKLWNRENGEFIRDILDSSECDIIWRIAHDQDCLVVAYQNDGLTRFKVIHFTYQ